MCFHIEIENTAWKFHGCKILWIMLPNLLPNLKGIIHFWNGDNVSDKKLPLEVSTRNVEVVNPSKNVV